MNHEQSLLTLNRLYDYMQKGQEKLSTIQNWCLTTWIATLTVAASPQFHLSTRQGIALSGLAIGAFWVLASFHFMLVELATDRAARLEQLVFDSGIESARPEESMFVLGSAAIPARYKCRVLIRAMFLRETVTVFFGLLLAATAIFHLVL